MVELESADCGPELLSLKTTFLIFVFAEVVATPITPAFWMEPRLPSGMTRPLLQRGRRLRLISHIPAAFLDFVVFLGRWRLCGGVVSESHGGKGWATSVLGLALVSAMQPEVAPSLLVATDQGSEGYRRTHRKEYVSRYQQSASKAEKTDSRGGSPFQPRCSHESLPFLHS